MKLKLNSLIFAAVLVMILVTSVVSPEARILSDYKYGSYDSSLYLYEEAIRTGQASEEQMIIFIEKGAFSQPVVAQLLDDGYCRQYEERLKAGGWLAQDYVIPGDSSQSNTNNNTTTTTPSTDTNNSNASNSNNTNTSTGDTNSSSNTENDNSNKTDESVTTTDKKEYTEAEIEAAWKETKRTDATCTEAGAVSYKNTITGEKKTEDIPALGHSYEVTTEVLATCNADGYTEYTCKVCEDTYQDVIAQLQHEEGDWKTEQEASLFTNGKEVKSCELCGAVLEENVIEKTCPIPLGGVITIAVAVIGAIAAGIVFGMKKKK